MIRHIVFFTVKPQNVEAVRAGLSILTEIPHARLLEIGTNVKTDGFHRGIDLVVYGEFEDEAALAAYKAHPSGEAAARGAVCGGLCGGGCGKGEAVKAECRNEASVVKKAAGVVRVLWLAWRDLRR
jgi:hypothetical protein